MLVVSTCPYLKPSKHTCKSCQKQYEMPYEHCCLDECGEHQFCQGCKKGIYLTKEPHEWPRTWDIPEELFRR